MLSLYRRHLEDCPHRNKGRNYTKCACPIHCDGHVNDQRVRLSMDTGSWDRARRKLGEIEEELNSPRIRKELHDTADSFLEAREVESSTARKYRRVMARLKDFAKLRSILYLDEVSLELLDDYRASRPLNALSWSKELQLLRTFFAFCQKRKWCPENPAKDMEMPADPKPKPREPYTKEEIDQILSACDQFGKGSYERLRAKALILLLRRYALRISDAATLERERIRDGRIFLHAMKNGASLWLPLWEDVQRALEAVPPPQGTDPGGRYFFWSGLGAREGHIKTVDRTLQAVFRKSGVKRASAHRFRHTLATEILVNGGSIEDAANILGDSPAIIRKHYAKWSTAYQTRTLELLERVHGKASGTSVTRGENVAISPLDGTSKLVLEVGVEPT